MNIKSWFTAHSLRSRWIILIGATSVFTLLVGVGIFAPDADFHNGLQSLSALRRLASRYVENPPLDNNDIRNPRYTQFLKGAKPGFIRRPVDNIRSLFGLGSPAFSPSYFSHLLDDQVGHRTGKRYKGYFVHKIAATEGAQVVVFGDVQGAYHSLVRCLDRLQSLGLMDEHLKLKNPNTYIVFLGDVVGRSPYIVPTLGVIMKLMQLNDKQVFYLQGSLESGNTWTHFGLPEELAIRADRYSDEKPPFARNLKVFFESLPRAIYLQIPGHNAYDVIRLSYFNRGRTDLIDENDFAGFLRSTQNKTVSTYRTHEKLKLPIDATDNVRCIVKSVKKRAYYDFHDGLQLLPPDHNATAWSVLSCPTSLYQQALRFSTDSFAIIEEAGRVEQWTITHHVQDAVKKDGWSTRAFQLLTGAVLTEEPKEKPEVSAVAPAVDEVEEEVLVDHVTFEKLYAQEQARRHEQLEKRRKERQEFHREHHETHVASRTLRRKAYGGLREKPHKQPVKKGK